MKYFISMVAVSAALFLVLTNASPALARNGWGLEDPQLCVNGELLTVIPAGPTDVYVQVPKRATVDFVVEDCGGKSKQGVVLQNHVVYLGANAMRVSAFAESGTQVTFSWSGQTVVDVARLGVATAKFDTR